jgi:hypothetical protein
MFGRYEVPRCIADTKPNTLRLVSVPLRLYSEMVGLRKMIYASRTRSFELFWARHFFEHD